jgi:hypothetical protein
MTRAHTRAHLSQNSGWGQRFMATGSTCQSATSIWGIRPDAKRPAAAGFYGLPGWMRLRLSFGTIARAVAALWLGPEVEVRFGLEATL